MGECQTDGERIQPLNPHLIAGIIDAPQRPPILQSKRHKELALCKQDEHADRLSLRRANIGEVLWYCGCSAVARHMRLVER